MPNGMTLLLIQFGHRRSRPRRADIVHKPLQLLAGFWNAYP
jgi:hypothetical protein